MYNSINKNESNNTDNLNINNSYNKTLMAKTANSILFQVVWFFEDEPITPGSDLFIETTDTYTSLRIQVH
jgi:hypothetical protein